MLSLRMVLGRRNLQVRSYPLRYWKVQRMSPQGMSLGATRSYCLVWLAGGMLGAMRCGEQ